MNTNFNEISSQKGIEFNKPSYNYFTLNKLWIIKMIFPRQNDDYLLIPR